MATSIILVDDHTLVSNAIADLINHMDEYTVIHQFKHGQELLDYLKTAQKYPDIILLDMNMPVLNGLETMKQLKTNYPGIQVLALSMNDDDLSVIQMMKAGACGYLSKQVTEDELLLALQSVVKKGYYYTDQVMHLVVHDYQQVKQPNIQLTDREQELMRYIATEMTYKEIAEKMCLSPKTIDGYREDLFQKLDIKSRVGLAVYAIKEGYYIPE